MMVYLNHPPASDVMPLSIRKRVAGIAFIVASWTAHAAPVLDTSGIDVRQPNVGSFGLAFSLTERFIVEGLGVFDAGADGLSQGHQVALFSSTGGAVIGPTAVGSSDPLVVSSSIIGAWRVRSVGPLVLDPGTYLVVGFNPAGTDAVPYGPFTDAPWAQREVGYYFLPGASLTFPTFRSFVFSPTNVTVTGRQIPEPSTLAIAALALALTWLRLGSAGRPRHPRRRPQCFGRLVASDLAARQLHTHTALSPPVAQPQPVAHSVRLLHDQATASQLAER